MPDLTVEVIKAEIRKWEQMAHRQANSLDKAKAEIDRLRRKLAQVTSRN